MDKAVLVSSAAEFAECCVLQGGQFSQNSAFFDRATTHLVGGPLDFALPTAAAAAATTNAFPFGATSAFIADFNGAFRSLVWLHLIHAFGSCSAQIHEGSGSSSGCPLLRRLHYTASRNIRLSGRITFHML